MTHSPPAAAVENGTSQKAGVYLHWPFCARKCPYCDFYTFGREHPNFEKSGRYLPAMIEEIRRLPERLELSSLPVVDTIYFGGGTPSLMEPEQLQEILAALRAVFQIEPHAEITMEVNPTAAEAERLVHVKALGVNRLSIGCQSFQDDLLKVLGRDHNADEARRTLHTVRELGFLNVSLDLMFGLPHQTLDDLREDLDEALSFEPEHISAYGLTLHEGTPFKRWHAEGRWKLPESEVEAAQFEWLIDSLNDNGYVQYEISNWSLPGWPSRHNSKYWQASDVYALGASAHGVLGGRRYFNPRDLDQYLGMVGNSALNVAITEPQPDPRSAVAEIMMLALRRVQGVTWRELNAWVAAWVPGWTEKIQDFFRAELQRLLSENLIEMNSDGLHLTRHGILFADQVVERFF